MNLGFTQIYLKLMIDGVGSQPFSATSLDTIPGPDKNSDQEIIAYSREKYCKPKKQVEENIAEWFMPVVNISSQNSEAVQSAQQRQTDGAQLNGQNSNLKQKTPQNTNQNTNRQPSNEQISRSNNQQSARLQNENNIQNSPKSNFQKQNISTQNNVRNKPEQEPQSKIKDLIKQIESGAIVEVSKEHGDGQQDKIPLASLARDKSISLSDNKSNLRDAIAKALKESEVAKKLVEQEVKKEIPVTDSRVVEKNKEDSKEVPEDVLKKLLE